MSSKAGDQPAVDGGMMRSEVLEIHRSPVRLLIVTIVAIFGAEVVAMLAVYVIQPLPYFQITLIDAGIMTILIFPVLYYFSFRPLIREMEKSWQAEESLLQSKELQEKFFDSINTLIAYMDRDFNFIRVNHAYAIANGCQPEFFIGKNHFALFPHAENEAIFKRVVDSGEAFSVNEKPFEFPEHPELGVTYWDWSLQPVKGSKGNVEGLVLSLLDVTERRQSADRLWRVNRALSVLNECNQLLVRAEKETELLQQMCEIIVNVGGYRMAWVGFAEQDPAKSVRPVAQFGFENGYLDLASITWADDERGRGPTGTAIRQGVLQVNQDFLTNPHMKPWLESALLRGYQSSIALPLQAESNILGALTIYSASRDSFDKEEVHLLKELANDLVFGIIALRVRDERNQALQQAREMALFSSLNPDAVLGVDSAGQVTMSNQAAEKIGLRIHTELTDVIPSLRELDITSCIATGTTQQIEETHLGNQTLLWTIRGIPELGLAFLYSSDITLRKQAEDLNRQLSRIVEQTEDTVVVTNCDGVIEYVNPAFERLTGYTAQETLGKTPGVLKSGLQDKAFYEDLWNTILRGEVFQSEIANRKKNGELFYEVKTITPLRDTQGQITHFVATGKDITEHKQDEEELRRAYDELELRVQERTEDLRMAISKLQDVNEQLEIQAVELEAQAAELKEQRERLAVSNEYLLISQEGLSRAQEIAHLGSWELDLIHNRLTWSDEVYRIFGLQPQEFAATYEAFLEAVHPDDRLAVDAAYSGSIREGQDRYEIEHRIIKRSNGEVRIVHEKCEHVRDEAGQIVRSLGMVHDITDRKRAEEEIRASEERFRAVVENAMDAIIVSNPSQGGKVLSANPAACRMFGYSLEEFKRLRREDILDTSDPNLAALLERRGRHGHASAELTYKLKDGTRFSGEMSSVFYQDKNGEQRAVAIIRDSTERKRAEEIIRAARDELEVRVQERTEELVKEIAERKEIEQQLRTQATAMESAANGIIITDRQGNIQWINPALRQISGYEAHELIGQNMRVFRSGQHDESYYHQMWNTILSGEVWRGETTNRRKDGRLYVEDQTITPVRGEQGEITQFIAIKQDITARKRAEEEIKERNQKEIILTQTIHTMQLDIARDLHDTIGQNISFLRMKLDHLAGKKKAKQADMKIELQNMAKAADDSYDLMRGTLAILQSEHSTDLYRLFTRYAEQIETRSSFKMNSSSQGEPRFLSAKRMRQLFYIFREILSNIEKHANASQVCMEMTWGRDTLDLIVSDNGSGFELDKVQYGSHYGLRFMKERAELLSGSLTVRSAIGTGTSVTLQVPYE